MIEEKLYPLFKDQEDDLDAPEESLEEDLGEEKEEEPVAQDEDEENSEM